MRKVISIGLGLVMLVTWVATTGVQPARAAGTVTTCNEASLLAALAGGGTVTFACGGLITLTATITIAADTVIDATGQTVTLSGNSAVQVLSVNSGRSLTLRNITIQGGAATDGGGLANNGGTVTIVNSNFSGNTATGNGGGVYNNGGTVTVVNSTFANNNAVGGGGIFNNGGTVNLANVTLSGNTATTGSGSGGGVNNSSGTANVKNTIIAGNAAAGGAANPDVSGNFSSLGYNLIGDSTGSSGFTVTGDQVGTPSLGTLTGSPAYFPLNAGSLGINAGNPAGCTDFSNAVLTTDQRGTGFPRPRSGRCDVGAYELQANAAPVATSATINPTEDTPFAGTLGATDTDPNPIFTFTLVSNGTRGTATITNASTGEFTYIPNANENGVDFFTFRVNDTEADSTTATVTVNIAAVNDQPTLNPIGNVTYSVGSLPQTVGLTGIGSGAANETQTLTVTAVSGTPATATVSVVYTSPLSTGSLIVTPVAAGTTTITVTLNDGGSVNNTIVRTFTVTVAQATNTFTPTNTFTASNTPTPTGTSTPGPTSTITPSITNTPIPPSPSPSATPAPKIPLFSAVPPTPTIDLTQTTVANAALTSIAATAAAMPTSTPNAALTETSIAATSGTSTPAPTVGPTATITPTFAFPSETGVLSISQAVGRAGGRFTCGIWVLDMPKDAIPEGSAIHCQTVSSEDSSAPSLPSNLRGFWQVVDISITGSAGQPITTFTQPLLLCGYYSENYKTAAGGDAAQFKIYTSSEGEPWRALNTTADPVAPRVCAAPDHLSLFRLAAQPPSAAEVVRSTNVAGIVAIACGVLLLVVVIIVVIALLRRRSKKEEAKAK